MTIPRSLCPCHSCVIYLGCYCVPLILSIEQQSYMHPAKTYSETCLDKERRRCQQEQCPHCLPQRPWTWRTPAGRAPPPLASSVKAFTIHCSAQQPCHDGANRESQDTVQSSGHFEETSPQLMKSGWHSRTRLTGPLHQQQLADHVHCVRLCCYSGLQAQLCLLLLPQVASHT